MKRREIIALGARRLQSLMDEHGTPNRFLASEVGDGKWNMATGRYGSGIALAVTLATGKVVNYAGRGMTGESHSYFIVP